MANMGRTKKPIGYNEGVQFYNVRVCKLRRLAYEVDAVYKTDKVILVSTKKSEKYLEGLTEI